MSVIPKLGAMRKKTVFLGRCAYKQHVQIHKEQYKLGSKLRHIVLLHWLDSDSKLFLHFVDFFQNEALDYCNVYIETYTKKCLY